MSPEQKQIGFEKLPEPEKQLEIVETKLPEQEVDPNDDLLELQGRTAHSKQNFAEGGGENQYEIVKNQPFEQARREGQKFQNDFAISGQESVIDKFRQNRFLSIATFASIAVVAVIGIFFLIRG